MWVRFPSPAFELGIFFRRAPVAEILLFSARHPSLHRPRTSDRGVAFLFAAAVVVVTVPAEYGLGFARQDDLMPVAIVGPLE